MALGVALAAVLTNLSPAVAGAARKPNVVYFILDDLGYYELSCLGHPELRTPNIDRLAARGIRFTQMLAGGPVCAPTRCALLTGKHAGHMTVRANEGSAALRAEEETLGSLFKRAGYATGGFGKWGVGARGTSGVPETHGFDLFFGYYDQVHAHTYFPRYLVRNSVEVPLPGNTGLPQQGATFSQYRICEEAKAFIRQHRREPFFAYCAWTPPHGLWGIPRTDPAWALYKDKPWTVGQVTREDARIYAAMLSLADRQIGEIVALIQELGLERETLIVFSGDNGGQPYFPSRDHPDGIFAPNIDPRTGVKFRGGKDSLYEGGLRVPFIVCWPGTIAGGRVSDWLGYFPDVMPTLAELLGVACPPGSDGLSFAPTLLGQGEQKQHSFLYWEYGSATAVRQGKWKLIRPNPAKPWQLYDLAQDISEASDLAAAQPERVAEMAALAQSAHTPVRPGAVLDPALVSKDRDYLGKTAPVQPPAN